MAHLLAGESLVVPATRPSPGVLGQAIGLVAAGCAGALDLLWRAVPPSTTVAGRAASGLVIGLGVVLVVRFWLRCRGMAITITDQRVIVEKGIEGLVASVPIASVTTASAGRSLTGALLDYGSIRIDLDSGRAIVCTGIPDARLLVDQLFVLADQARRGI
jgi:hypothetical protein